MLCTTAPLIFRKLISLKNRKICVYTDYPHPLINIEIYTKDHQNTFPNKFLQMLLNHDKASLQKHNDIKK